MNRETDTCNIKCRHVMLSKWFTQPQKLVALSYGFLAKMRTWRPIQLPPIAFTVRIIDYYDHVPRPTHATLISCALPVDLLFAIRQIVHQPCISYKSPFHAAGHLSNEWHIIYIGTLHFSTESTNYQIIVNNIWTDTGLFVSSFRWGSFVDISLQKPW